MIERTEIIYHAMKIAWSEHTAEERDDYLHEAEVTLNASSQEKAAGPELAQGND